MSPRAAFALVGLLVIGLAGIVVTTIRVRFAYDDEPIESASTPLVQVVPVDVSQGFTNSSGGSSTARVRKYEFLVYNATDLPKHYRIVDESFDHRGKLVRRHIVGPVEVPPHTGVNVNDELHLSRREARFIATWSSRLEPPLDEMIGPR